MIFWYKYTTLSIELTTNLDLLKYCKSWKCKTVIATISSHAIRNESNKKCLSMNMLLLLQLCTNISVCIAICFICVWAYSCSTCNPCNHQPLVFPFLQVYLSSVLASATMLWVACQALLQLRLITAIVVITGAEFRWRVEIIIHSCTILKSSLNENVNIA